MKRLTFLLGTALLLAACSPQTFTMNIEMRNPSRSGLDLANKSMAVVYEQVPAKGDSVFLRSIASGFARKMEDDYFGGKEVIHFFQVPKDTASTVRKSYMQDLVMDTGDDVVFLFSQPEYGAIGTGENKPVTFKTGKDSAYVCPVVIPFKMKVYAYDALNKSDKLLYFSGSTSVRPQVFNDGLQTYDNLVDKAWTEAGPLAEQIGSQATGNFVSTWKPERFTFYYFDSFETEWDSAAQAAFEYRWADAIGKWTSLVKKYPAGSRKRACAEYNLASAFFILGNYSLSTRWLDQADADCELSLSPGLRKRISLKTANN